jgi:hypothetical protein
LPDSFFLLFLGVAPIALAGPAPAANTPPPSQLYAGGLQMYDLKFDDVHRTFAAWRQNDPEDSPGPASDAAAYLFSELARLGALESELFVDDSRFRERAKLRPDPVKKVLFDREVARAERLAYTALQKSAADPNALFVKSLTFGLRADNAGLIEKQSFAALSVTKEGRVYAQRLIHSSPLAGDAYLGPGVENCLLSLMHYLEPFARLLLAVAALRDNDPARAPELPGELHRRFPDNELCTREMDRIEKGAH